MEKQAKSHYTVEEYLALEENADHKSEYYRGEIFAMAGASVNHNRIVVNLITQLRSKLRNTGCEPFMSDMRLWIEAHELYAYPDITIICGDPQFHGARDDTIINPLVIIEILSDSTKDYDRGTKFQFYRSLASFREYILIEQDTVHIEHFHIGRQGRWILHEYDDETEALKLFTVKFRMLLREIYAGVIPKPDKPEIRNPKL